MPVPSTSTTTHSLSKFVKLHLSLEVFLSSLLSHYIHISHAYLGLLPKDRIGLMPYTPTKITTISNAPSELISSSYCSCTQQSLHFIPLRLCVLSTPTPLPNCPPFPSLITPQVENKVMIVMLRKATKVHVYLQCFSLSLSKPERSS